MSNKISVRFFLALTLLFSLFTVSLPSVGYAQTPAQTQTADELKSRLSSIEEKLEKRRLELGIPGMALAIVKDGEVIFSKGLGYKDFEKKVSVTPDTQFAIGSATKAFTGLSVLMSQDEGKVSLEDNPKKFLPYFKMYDAETNKNITVRDLLAHSSGLNRTDLAMLTGKLTRQELIQVAGEAKPTAKLREKFQYQNLMYTAAGEVVAKVQKMPWEKFVPEKIFKPLGMNNSTMTMKEMQKVKDYSFGYQFNFDTKETRRLPFREIDEVAPAGSINSSANDMAKWLKFILNKGELNGKRLVSANGFEEWVKPQTKITPDGKMAYGLGWFLQEWKGLKVVQHGGNIDGFNSLVATIPEKNLGFVMLTNVTASSLGSELMPIVWEGILGEKKAENRTASKDAEKETGKYNFAAAGFDIEVKIEDGKLVAVVPNQPVYTLENVGGRKYKLGGAPDGFFITFKDDSLYLEQPQGNFTLPKTGANVKTAASGSDAVKELTGKYESEQAQGQFIEVKEVDGKVSLVVGNQPPYPLIVKGKDEFRSPNLPEAYSLKAKRTADGKISGLVLVQPEGEFGFKNTGETAETETPKISVDELIAKTIEAMGGEANWRKLNSRMTKFDINFEHQGVKGTGISYSKAPNMASMKLSLNAVGKEIATIEDYFDGVVGGETTSFSPAETYTGKRLEDVKLLNDFYGLLNWKDFKSAKVESIEKVGDEEVYKVGFESEKASKLTFYISTKTFLPLKRGSMVVSSTSSQSIPVTETYADYRTVDGVMMPFKTTTSNPAMGEIVVYVKEVKHNVEMADSVFKAKK